MPHICTELTAVAILVLATCYGALMSGAAIEVVFDFSTAVGLLGLAVTIANAAAREFATVTVRWGVDIIMRVVLL